MPDLGSLLVPAFIAGILTFLAPCTLPLLPGYLGFISGVSLNDLKDPDRGHGARLKIFYNGLFYVVGFSSVFIALGTIFAFGGAALVQYRIWLSRIGGLFVIFFGLYMLNVLKFRFLNFLVMEKKFAGFHAVKPGNPLSSFIFGTTFAFGWTPCVGPILGSILFLASSTATVSRGAFLLAIFSLGLAIPFLAVALGIGSVLEYLSKLSRVMNAISIIGGIFLIFLGILLLTNKFGVWLSYAYQIFDFVEYDKLLDYL